MPYLTWDNMGHQSSRHQAVPWPGPGHPPWGTQADMDAAQEEGTRRRRENIAFPPAENHPGLRAWDEDTGSYTNEWIDPEDIPAYRQRQFERNPNLVIPDDRSALAI